MNELTVFDALREILIHELEVDETRVNIYNQKIDTELLKEEGLFIYLESIPPTKVISSRNTEKWNASISEYQSVQDITVQDKITIGIFSRNLDALTRKEEVVMALYSTYAQQVQEVSSFKIFRIAPIENISDLEGAARLYRFDIPVTLITWHQKIKKVDFYDQFRTRVRVNDGSPDIVKEFDQPTT
jgi:hypothetical protein